MVNGMERAIEHATKVIGDLPGFNDAQVRGIAEDLAEAGLLAPAPLREEWGVQWDDHDIWGLYLNHDEATVGAGDEGTPVHRWVTEWETP